MSKIPMVINLDKNFSPTTLPQLDFETFIFHGGEQHFKLDKERFKQHNHSSEHVVITHRLRNGTDIMLVLLAHNALKLRGYKRFELVIPYVPYGRQDRMCAWGEAFSLEVFAQLINSMGCEKVHMFDAHSNATSILIKNSKDDYRQIQKHIAHSHSEIYSTLSKKGILISPDAGASSKSNALFVESRLFTSITQCLKKRNPKDGSLSGFQVFADDLKGKDCWIVDDICDGGGTFLGLAKELKKKNAGNLYLFVTHGIFSKGYDELGKHFKRIFTTNAFSDIEHDLVTQHKLEV